MSAKTANILSNIFFKMTHGNAIAYTLYRAGALVQWLKLPAWKIGNREIEPHSGFQVSKKRVSPLLTRKDLILWGASVTSDR